VAFAGPKRVTAPGVAFDALPPIDLVLVSHNHYDHLDLATLARLDARHRPRVLVPLGNAAPVQAAMPASTVSEHDWGAVATMGALRITFEPMLHGSGRTPFDQQRTLWAAFVLEAAGLKLLHVGDSAYGDGRLWGELAARHGGFDLAVLPIGAYEPRSFMADSHMNPAEAVQARAALKARVALAHHFEAFPLGFEPFEAPRQALADAMKAAGLADGSFIAPHPGQALVLRPAR
jgi:L-ascorbate metabolism protein UlaG (beta-lactamase superfamily)